MGVALATQAISTAPAIIEALSKNRSSHTEKIHEIRPDPALQAQIEELTRLSKENSDNCSKFEAALAQEKANAEKFKQEMAKA